MSNILTPFGFLHIGYLEGYTPSYGFRRRKIALGNTNPIFHGDPVATVSASGYISQASTNGTGGVLSIAGVFESCEYVSVSQQRKVRSLYWPGSDAQFDVDCFIIDAAGALFKAQSNGSPILYANIENNIGYFIAIGGSTAPVAGSGQGNTVNGYSGALLDVAGTNSGGSGAIATTSTLPFRIVRLFSDDMIPGAPVLGGTQFNGTDQNTNFNMAIVTFNNSDSKALIAR